MITIDRIGIEFHRKGDTIIWIWPWRRTEPDKRYISVGFSGNGEFGDAVFATLREIDEAWEGFSNAADNVGAKDRLPSQP